MGKEPAGVHRPPKFIRRVQSQSDLASEASSAWSAIKTSHTEIAENGYVVVILRYKTDTMVVCTGLKNEGNKFIKLGRLLKRGGVVPRQGVDLTFFVQRNIVWEYVEDWKKGSYRSGEKLLVLVEKKNTRQFKRAQVNKNDRSAHKIVARSRKSRRNNRAEEWRAVPRLSNRCRSTPCLVITNRTQ
eukprot:TRINITY_DN1879_c0_g1_i2.p1 TRINITY_DN1879_c0_g1~~TRINITY_DN1879_c0_g1_i2.p1  ORF type:complete len:186 (-),score=1.12 TRINITY_DN1879_c0_g1_i2:390-947(-)